MPKHVAEGITVSQLTGTNFSGTLLTVDSGAFRQLTGTFISGTSGTLQEVTGTHVTGTDFWGSSGSFLKLTGSYITGTYISGAYYTGTFATLQQLTGTYVSGVHISGAYYTGTFVSSSYISATSGTIQQLTGTFISGTSGTIHVLTGTFVTGTSGTFQQLTGSFFSGTSGTFSQMFVGTRAMRAAYAESYATTSLAYPPAGAGVSFYFTGSNREYGIVDPWGNVYSGSNGMTIGPEGGGTYYIIGKADVAVNGACFVSSTVEVTGVFMSKTLDAISLPNNGYGRLSVRGMVDLVAGDSVKIRVNVDSAGITTTALRTYVMMYRI